MVIKRKNSKKQFILFSFFFLFLSFTFSLVSGLEIGDNTNIVGVSIIPEKITGSSFNNDTAYVNSTSIWVTDEGDMENIPDLYPTLDNKYLELSGTNANQNIDINSFNLTLGNKITFALGGIIETIRTDWIRIQGGLEVNGPMNITDPDNGIAMYMENSYIVVEG